jgi:hypothetical protein
VCVGELLACVFLCGCVRNFLYVSVSFILSSYSSLTQALPRLSAFFIHFSLSSCFLLLLSTYIAARSQTSKQYGCRGCHVTFDRLLAAARARHWRSAC